MWAHHHQRLALQRRQASLNSTPAVSSHTLTHDVRINSKCTPALDPIDTHSGGLHSRTGSRISHEVRTTSALDNIKMHEVLLRSGIATRHGLGLGAVTITLVCTAEVEGARRLATAYRGHWKSTVSTTLERPTSAPAKHAKVSSEQRARSRVSTQLSTNSNGPLIIIRTCVPQTSHYCKSLNCKQGNMQHRTHLRSHELPQHDANRVQIRAQIHSALLHLSGWRRVLVV